MINQAFGRYAEARIVHFLKEKELSECHGDTARWESLFKKCDIWKKEFLLWKSDSYINGIHGWNLSISAGRFRLPKQEPVNWVEYLYYISLILIIEDIDLEHRNILKEYGDKYNNFETYLRGDLYIESGCTPLTPKQWIEEITSCRKESWEQYRLYPGNNPDYQKDMEENYPKYDDILHYLENNTKSCSVIRINDYGGDDSIWYFAKDNDSFYLVWISDAM